MWSHMHKLRAIDKGPRFDDSTSRCRLPGTTKGGMAMRTSIAGLLLGVLLTTNAHGQTPSVPASGTVPVAAETGYVIKFKVKPGKNADFEKAISEMMVEVRKKEPGNLYCDLFHAPEDLQIYVIIERYKDVEAAKAHGDSEYIKKLGDTLKNNLLDAPPELQALTFIRSK